MTTGKVTGIVSNLLTIQVNGPVLQNEICYVYRGEVALRAEVIRISGDIAFAQVFEPTRAIGVGAKVEFTGKLLEIALGPGMLTRNYDGLQNDLERMEGLFLNPGEYTIPLDETVGYDFEPLAQTGDTVLAADWLGQVKEGWLEHKIMVPFGFEGKGTVRKIVAAGSYTVKDIIAEIETAEGSVVKLSMSFSWPVKRAILAYREKLRPYRIFSTGMRAIDTVNPIAEGGTGYIPGPFGSGKTVLQQSIAKNSEVDLVILVACGERANEVVEIFEEFPKLKDPRTGRNLQERTCIICNTSNMPVAAREASVYVGMTIAEYYRSMGIRVLLLADSTSRWAQALREMSNRLEELPGPDAYPVDLPAVIANFYARAGTVKLNNGKMGAVTFLGTVSPAGGNFKEPVTESTSKVARCFYALSQKRADSKRYPAIEPLESYSRYLDYVEFQEHTQANLQEDWIARVYEARDLLQKGAEARDQINILGDDAVPIEYHLTFWRAETLDFCFLQQDSFDEVDANVPMVRQQYMLNKLLDFCRKDFAFDDFEEVAVFYKKAINIFKQMNYSEWETEGFKKFEKQADELIASQALAEEPA